MQGTGFYQKFLICSSPFVARPSCGFKLGSGAGQTFPSFGFENHARKNERPVIVQVFSTGFWERCFLPQPIHTLTLVPYPHDTAVFKRV